MKFDAIIFFPDCNEINELHYRLVLIEKIRKEKYSFPTRCCTINDVAIFTDGDAAETAENCYRGINNFRASYVRLNEETERVLTDSYVIQKIVNAIELER